MIVDMVWYESDEKDGMVVLKLEFIDMYWLTNIASALFVATDPIYY